MSDGEYILLLNDLGMKRTELATAVPEELNTLAAICSDSIFLMADVPSVTA